MHNTSLDSRSTITQMNDKDDKNMDSFKIQLPADGQSDPKEPIETEAIQIDRESLNWKTNDSTVEPIQTATKELPKQKVDQASRLSATKTHESAVPQKIGRFSIRKQLGKGGFGVVYLGFDEQLKREVAIKLTFGSKVGPKAAKLFLKEAQILADLDHSNIIPVFDVGTNEQDDIFIVSKLIDGTDLATRINKDRPSRRLSLDIIIAIADALQHAHSRGLIHRDIKPANILLDKNDKPYLADFGLALRETELAKEGEISGTFAYMSPEQAAGEGHRIDNRSDIYSLGVVLFELLTGRRPFKGANTKELLSQVKLGVVKTPRMFDPTIPSEIERICLKALSRHPSDRYAIAKDLADEIRGVSQTLQTNEGLSLAYGSNSSPTSDRSRIVSSDSKPTDSPSAKESSPTNPNEDLRIVPRGLRSFDASDSDFFLELLPGPFDKDGLPQSIRFWKIRIEETQIERSFRVGLVYGPSGCGKTSLMKAGILPRLSSKIEPIYIEATPEDIHGRLLKEILKRNPDFPATNLAETLSLIRRRKLVPSGGKLLLIIDQFEQWLYAQDNYANSELTDALRQCDGETIQAIIMVRDDFWISVGRFLRELDIPILERENSAMVDLFDLDHAINVLGHFGTAFGRIPKDRSHWSDEQKQFIDQAVKGLSENSKVISVRLALFSEMMKGKPWVPKTILDMGGVSGVGETFLEEAFGQKHAPIQYRQHQEAVRKFLAALLPPPGSEIKGAKQTLTKLQDVCGYSCTPKEFSDLVKVLNNDLRLITPVDDSSTVVSYQLAHDYLVPSLREWLTRKQRETKKGRAELKLAERAAIWGGNQENKQLPTLWEWMQIRRWTDRKRWTLSEQKLMSRARKMHIKNSIGFFLASIIIGFIVFVAFQEQRLQNENETIDLAIDSLKALGPAVPVNIKKLREIKNPKYIIPLLSAHFRETRDHSEQLALAFALAHYNEPINDYLVKQVDFIQDRDTMNFVDALRQRPDESIASLSKAASECLDERLHQRKARLALAALAVGDKSLALEACEFKGIANPGVRTHFIDQIQRWKIDRNDLIATAQGCNSPALRSAIILGLGQIDPKSISEDLKRSIRELAMSLLESPDSTTHSSARWLLRLWELPEPSIKNSSKADANRGWFLNSQNVTFVKIDLDQLNFVKFKDPRIERIKFLKQMEDFALHEKKDSEARIHRANRLYMTGDYEQAQAEFEVLETMDLNSAKRKILDETKYTRPLLLARLKKSQEAQKALDELIAKDPNDYQLDYVKCLVRLWLGRKSDASEIFRVSLSQLATKGPESIEMLARTAALFAADESSTEEEKVNWRNMSIDLVERLIEKIPDARGGLRLVPEFIILHDDPRFIRLSLDLESIPLKPFWIANREVTISEFKTFLNDMNYQAAKPLDRDESRFARRIDVRITSDHPAHFVNWFDAVMYCNWLSEKEGRAPAYRAIGSANIKNIQNIEIEVDTWELDDDADGYRLPLEVEWDYAGRAGSSTLWSTGNDSTRLIPYAQLEPSISPTIAGKKLPNAWGLHDMHGNVREWCWLDYQKQKRGEKGVLKGGSYSDKIDEAVTVFDGGLVNISKAFNLTFRTRQMERSFRDDTLGFRLVLNGPKNFRSEEVKK